jgi:hypothetical protein
LTVAGPGRLMVIRLGAEDRLGQILRAMRNASGTMG